MTRLVPWRSKPLHAGVAELAAEDKRLTVAARLRSAAARRGLALTLLRTRGPRLRFRIERDGVDAGEG